MSATGAASRSGGYEVGTHDRSVRRLTTETKASFKTTEFFAMIAVIIGILVAAASIGASEGHPDKFIGSQAWLYVTIVASAYMVSRGLAKSGSREAYDDDRS
jgi:hypothetical protein